MSGLPTSLRQSVEQALGEPISGAGGVGGGCIAQAFTIKTVSGNRYFLKSVAGQQNMFRLEAEGLDALRAPGVIGVPEVLGVGDDFLILEHLEAAKPVPDFMGDFGTPPRTPASDCYCRCLRHAP